MSTELWRYTNLLTMELQRKSHFLVSKMRDHFVNVSEKKINLRCLGTSNLKLCLKPFSMSRTSKATCIPSLFFDPHATSLKLCQQEVAVQQEEPTADYIDDSSYLVTADQQVLQFYSWVEADWLSRFCVLQMFAPATIR